MAVEVAVSAGGVGEFVGVTVVVGCGTGVDASCGSDVDGTGVSVSGAGTDTSIVSDDASLPPGPLTVNATR